MNIVHNTIESLLNLCYYIITNKEFTIIITLILSFYIARISKDYTLPNSLYFFFDNLLVKTFILFLIVFLSKINLPLSIIVALSYILFKYKYDEQMEKSKENFSNLTEIIEKMETNKALDKNEINEEEENFECYRNYHQLN